MSTLSVKNYYERSSGVNLTADKPADTGFTWALIDNIAHMVDESFKYRINWVGGDVTDGTENYSSLFSGGLTVMYFTTQMARPNRFPRYDLRVLTYSELIGGGSPIIASIVPGNYNPSGNAFANGAIGSASGTIDFGYAESIDATFPVVTTDQVYTNPITMPNLAGGYTGMHFPMMLVIEYGLPVEPTHIIGVQLREYTE